MESVPRPSRRRRNFGTPSCCQVKTAVLESPFQICPVKVNSAFRQPAEPLAGKPPCFRESWPFAASRQMLPFVFITICPYRK